MPIFAGPGGMYRRPAANFVVGLDHHRAQEASQVARRVSSGRLDRTGRMMPVEDKPHVRDTAGTRAVNGAYGSVAKLETSHVR